MAPVLTASSAMLQMKCPSCGCELGDFPTLENPSVKCPKCEYRIFWDGDCWDACVDKAYPRSFARQWVLWEQGKLGDPNLVYGNEPKKYLRELLDGTSLGEADLQAMKILEVGYGHGRTLQQLQRLCPNAYGLDLARPPKSSQLRAGTAIFGNLLNMPFAPGQFDLVICRGVVHHTPNPSQSFACLAAQVADGGKLFFGGHYEPGLKASLQLRNLLPGSWLYPEPVLLALASILSAARAALESVQNRTLSFEAFRRSYAHYKLDIFDVMTPRWSSLHDQKEVTGWFKENGFQSRRLAPGEYVGVKTGGVGTTRSGE
jgi:SAM-dependent methyltransferase